MASMETSTSYLNSYKTAHHRYTPPEEYDLNFACDVPIVKLRSSRVELRPLIPSIHGESLYKHWDDISEVQFSHVTDCPTLMSRFEAIEQRRANPGSIYFAIFVDPQIYEPLRKNAPAHFDDPTASSYTRSWIFAGYGAINDYTHEHLSCSFGINTFAQLGRHGIGSHTIGLLLDWSLRLNSEGGLGLRRCELETQSFNVPCQKMAEGLGFKLEGIMRNLSVIPMRMSHEGNPVGRPGDEQWPKQSLNTYMYSATCDDWEHGGLKEKIRSLLKSR